MSSCPVCYEAFSKEDKNLIPLRLPCDDIICQGCISNDIFEGSFYCPECGFECKGASAGDMGTPVTLEEDGDQEFEEDYFTGRDSSHSRDTDTDTESTENSDTFSYNTPPAARDSLFAQFTQRTSASGSSLKPSITTTTTTDKMAKGLGDRYGVCKEPDCQNKACGIDGHCFNHSSNKKLHLVHENKLASLLARTSLDFVQINGQKNSFTFKSRPDIWPDVCPTALIERFKRQERMELGEAMALINRARDVLSREPNVLPLEAPVIAVGDIHGQFYDLLNMFEVGGQPGAEVKEGEGGSLSSSSSPYVFLGDYVDRGSFSCEVMLTLLAYKVAYPDKIWLIRGNTMPLAALVTTAYGDLFLCHGGLSPDILTIEDLDAIDRFVEPEENSALLDILWSDPISEERVDDMTDAEYEEFISQEWRPNPTRGCSYCYGYKAVHDFLNRNSIVSLVRAHEVQENGFHKHFDPAVIESRIKQSAKYKRKTSNAVTALRRLHSDKQIRYIQENNKSKDQSKSKEENKKEGKEEITKTKTQQKPRPVPPSSSAEEWQYPSHDIPTVITVFSAPNYCDRYDNQGAILKIAMGLDGFQFLQYSCVPHPVPDVIESQMTNQIMSVIQTCPYMPTSFKDFVRVAIELGHEDSSAIIEEGNEDEDDSDEDDEEVEVELVDWEEEDEEDESAVQENKRPKSLTPSSSSSSEWGKLKLKDRGKHTDNDTDNDSGKETPKKSLLTKLFHSIVPSSVGRGGSGRLEEEFRAAMKREEEIAGREGGRGGAKDSDVSEEESASSEEGSEDDEEVETIITTEDIVRVHTPPSSSSTTATTTTGTNNTTNKNNSPTNNNTPFASLINSRSSSISSSRSSSHSRSPPRVKTSPPRIKTSPPRSPPPLVLTTSLSETSPPQPTTTRLRNFSMSSIIPRTNSAGVVTATVSALSDRSDSSPPRNFNSLTSNKDMSSPERRHTSIQRQPHQHLRRATETYGTCGSPHAPHTSTYRLAHASDAINELHPVRVQKYMDNFAGVSDSPKRSSAQQQEGQIKSPIGTNEEEEEEEEDEFQRRITYLTEQFDKQSEINLKKIKSQNRHSYDGDNLTNAESRRRSASLNFIPSSPTSAESSSSGGGKGGGKGGGGVKKDGPGVVSGGFELLKKRSSGSMKGKDLHRHASIRESEEDEEALFKEVNFTKTEVLALRLLFSLFDRSGTSTIGYEDLVAYGEETGGLAGIRDAADAIAIVDIDGDGVIGLLDFIHFAARLRDTELVEDGP